MTNAGTHAVVLGASMAGLVTGRVLAEYFDRVTVVERDRLPDESGQRRGVPQGRHLHALLAGGSEVLEELFPGLASEMVDAGAHLGDIQADCRWYLGGARYQQAQAELPALAVSRPLLEAHVRRRVRAMPRIGVRDGHEVTGLVSTDGSVTGVRVVRRGDARGDERTVAADLVVDASGRGSRTPAWLEALGYPRPRRDQVRIGVGYTTRRYHLDADALDGNIAVVVGPMPGQTRVGALMLQEDGCAIVTLIGYVGDHAPTEPGGFLEYAASLWAPDIHDAIRDAEPIDGPVAIGFPASTRNRYERLRRFPEGLLVIGDALCSFNPIYAQGMSVAALEAETLRRCLEHGRPDLADRFFRRAARVVDRAWDTVLSTDLQVPGVEGPRPSIQINGYIARVHRAAAYDPRVARAFLRVSNLVDPPTRLLRPTVAARVLSRARQPSQRHQAGLVKPH